MGQKIHPIGFRVGIIRDWDSKWFYDKKQYASVVREDATIRSAILKRWVGAFISRTEIERAADRVRVTVHTARPAMIIGGKGGTKPMEELNNVVSKIVKRRAPEAKVYVNVNEVRPPDTDAQIVSQQIATQLEKRISHRRAMRQSIRRAMEMRAKGIKIICSGRLSGAEMARSESEKLGKIPLQTIRADIDYGESTAYTIYGSVGVRVWIYKGDILPEKVRQGGLGVQREREREAQAELDMNRRGRNPGRGRGPRNSGDGQQGGGGRGRPGGGRRTRDGGPPSGNDAPQTKPDTVNNVKDQAQVNPVPPKQNDAGTEGSAT